jgi:hypothetical protein
MVLLPLEFMLGGADRRRKRLGGYRPLLALLSWAAAGCTLGEVTATEGGDVLVVESHLEAGGARQAVLLHRSLQGELVRGEPGAVVTIKGPGGDVARLAQLPLEFCAGSVSPELTDSLAVAATCYATDFVDRELVHAGETYELEVLTTRGERVRGRTTVPGPFEFRAPPAQGEFSACRLPRRTNLPLIWTRAKGAWSYLATMEVMGLRAALEGTGIEAPERLELTGLAISESDTTLVIPADFGLFELSNVPTELLVYLQGGFPPGISVRVRVAALDRNYVNAIRGGSFNPSGPIRLSTVVGDGVGVFGSYVAHDLFIAVESTPPLPECLR